MHEERNGKRTLQPLNDTEIWALAMKRMVIEPYEKNVTADFNIFRKQNYDPHSGLMKFRKAA